MSALTRRSSHVESNFGGPALASAILRAVLGATMIAHGVRHGRTLEGTARWFESIGFRQAKAQAVTSSLLEVGAGAGLLAGAATPLVGASVVGTMAVAVQTVHRPNGFFVVDEGWEYVAFVAAGAVALSSLGAGPLSVDRRWGLDRIGRPWTRALFTLGLGVVGALVQLKVFWRRPAPAPVAEEPAAGLAEEAQASA